RFAGHEDLVDETLLVDAHGQRLADARIIERGASGVEPEKIGPEVVETVKIGARPEHAVEFGRDKFLVPDDVHVRTAVEIESGAGAAQRKQIDDLAMRVGGVPVVRVSAQAHAIVERPALELIRPADGERADAHPAVAMLLDEAPGHDVERLERAE